MEWKQAPGNLDAWISEPPGYSVCIVTVMGEPFWEAWTFTTGQRIGTMIAARLETFYAAQRECLIHLEEQIERGKRR